uniref:Chemokine interleukin-8-like domain-containing protein n=1 Tax=Mastacembelus armatus TaxID=205130 RepID=A0A3Q3ME55_9TELE
MVNCKSLLNSVLVTLILVTLTRSGSAAEKLATCCKTVNRQEITEPILGYLVQKANHPCVQAVIFQTESGLFCSQLTAPWVFRKITEFRSHIFLFLDDLSHRNAKPQSTQPSVVSESRVSLLSIITSTTSAPLSSSLSSTSPLPSFSSTFEPSASENLSERDSE